MTIADVTVLSWNHGALHVSAWFFLILLLLGAFVVVSVGARSK